RQKWLDQAQSLNLYMAAPAGRKLDELYRLAWVRRLKTTYYLRTLGATHMEKGAPETAIDSAPAACSIDDPDCEACQQGRPEPVTDKEQPCRTRTTSARPSRCGRKTSA